MVRETRKHWPFHIDAWVVLPDHLHCVWTLPDGDDDNSNRWRLIKQGFSKALPMTERRSAVRIARGERGTSNAVFGIMSSGMMEIMPRMSIIAISTRLNMVWLGECPTGLIQASIDMWNGAFIHWIGQRSRPLILLPGNADNRNGLYWGMKLDERKFQLLAYDWIRHSAQYAAEPLAPYAGFFVCRVLECF